MGSLFFDCNGGAWAIHAGGNRVRDCLSLLQVLRAMFRMQGASLEAESEDCDLVRHDSWT